VGDDSIHSPMTGNYAESDDRVAPPTSPPISYSSPFQRVAGWVMGRSGTSDYAMVHRGGSSAPSRGLFTIEGDEDDEEGKQQGL